MKRMRHGDEDAVRKCAWWQVSAYHARFAPSVRKGPRQTYDVSKRKAAFVPPSSLYQPFVAYTHAILWWALVGRATYGEPPEALNEGTGPEFTSLDVVVVPPLHSAPSLETPILTRAIKVIDNGTTTNATLNTNK